MACVEVVDESRLNLALSDGELRSVREILNTFAPEHNAWAFGSRVRSVANQKVLKPHADLDIALIGEPLLAQAMFVLRDAFSESDLPFRVDVCMKDELPLKWAGEINWFPLC